MVSGLVMVSPNCSAISAWCVSDIVLLFVVHMYPFQFLQVLFISLVQPFSLPPIPRRHKLTGPYPRPARPGLVFVGDIFSRIAPIGEGVALSH